jgi:hypothetical protein
MYSLLNSFQVQATNLCVCDQTALGLLLVGSVAMSRSLHLLCPSCPHYKIYLAGIGEA